MFLFYFPHSECSSAAPSPGKEWEEYVQIRALVEKIRKKQKGTQLLQMNDLGVLKLFRGIVCLVICHWPFLKSKVLNCPSCKKRGRKKTDGMEHPDVKLIL